MSVVLTACRHSKQRAIERALKKKAEKQKQKRQLMEQQYVNDYAMDLSQLALTRMWSFQMMGNIYTVVLLLESGRDIVDIYCNEEELSYITDIDKGSITFDFLIDGSYKARIKCENQDDGLQHSLTVLGSAVPECE